MNVCLYVRNLYKFTFLNRSEPNFAHVSPWSWRDRRVCMDPKFLTSSTLWAPFLWGPLQNHRHKMAAGATVFRDTLISVIPAGVRVMSPTWRRRRRSHPRQSYIRSGSSSRRGNDIVADDRVIRHSVVSVIPVGVRVTSRVLRSIGRQGHTSQRYIPHSSSCFYDLQEITFLQTNVARFYSKCVALSVMRAIRWDVNGIHVSTIWNLIRGEGSY
jgi:hypothetical protein